MEEVRLRWRRWWWQWQRQPLTAHRISSRSALPKTDHLAIVWTKALHCSRAVPPWQHTFRARGGRQKNRAEIAPNRAEIAPKRALPAHLPREREELAALEGDDRGEEAEDADAAVHLDHAGLVDVLLQGVEARAERRVEVPGARGGGAGARRRGERGERARRAPEAGGRRRRRERTSRAVC